MATVTPPSEPLCATYVRTTTPLESLSTKDRIANSGYVFGATRATPDPFWRPVAPEAADPAKVTKSDALQMVLRCTRLMLAPMAVGFGDSVRDCAAIQRELWHARGVDLADAAARSPKGPGVSPETRMAHQQLRDRLSFAYDPATLPWAPRPEYLALLRYQGRLAPGVAEGLAAGGGGGGGASTGARRALDVPAALLKGDGK